MNFLLWSIFSGVIIFSVVAHPAEKVKLSSGYEIPLVGLGTGSLDSAKAEEMVNLALEKGYRHFDTAYVYKNEKGIGNALKKWLEKGGKREDLFITSKLPFFANRPGGVEKYLTESLKNLGLDYVDMYLIHAPIPVVADESGSMGKKVDGKFVFEETFDYEGVWKDMEEQVKDGHAKSIGVSNFNKTQLEAVYHSATVKPSNLQVEAHAYFSQKPLRDYCKEHNIVMTAYAPLGASSKLDNKGPDFPILLENPAVKEIAEKYNKTTAQILLRFSVQRGIVVIPKTSNPDRLRSNIHVFDFKLMDEDYKKLDALDQGEDGRVYNFKEYMPGVENTPFYPFKSAESANTEH